jgi:hypothetical protein
MCQAFAPVAWPTSLSEVGTNLSTTFGEIDNSRHYRPASTGTEQNPQYLTWVDEYVFSIDLPGSIVIGARAFAFADQLAAVRFKMTATLQRLGNAFVFV